MNREEFQTERTRIISEMLDNPDEYGIYPTTKCFEQLDALFDSLSLPHAEGAEQIASDLSLTIGLLEAEIDSLKDAYKSDGLNSREYSSAILSHKTALKILKGNISQKPLQPTAEGAKEILEKHLNLQFKDTPEDWTVALIQFNQEKFIAAMQDFATLHAQRIAEGAEEIEAELRGYARDIVRLHKPIMEVNPQLAMDSIGNDLVKMFNRLAQRLAEKMVEKRLREELMAYDKFLSNTYWGVSHLVKRDEAVDEYLKSR